MGADINGGAVSWCRDARVDKPGRQRTRRAVVVGGRQKTQLGCGRKKDAVAVTQSSGDVGPVAVAFPLPGALGGGCSIGRNNYTGKATYF